MMTASVERESWSRVRWWLAIALALVLQIGLVLWLSDRSRIIPRPPANTLAVYLANDPLSQRLASPNPLRFSPADSHGFSGPLWLNTPKLEYHLSDWTAPPGLLELTAQNLGNAFSRFIQTNAAFASAIADNPEPRVASPQLFALDLPMATQSTLQIEGELAQRSLVFPLALPNCTNTDVLSPTVVQVAVDRDGNTVSASLLSPSGGKDADKRALELAKAARYQSLRGNAPGQAPGAALNWGRLVFNWHTVPLPATNPPSKP